MNIKVNILYDVYRSKADPSLRIATAPGARLPVHIKAKDWSLMPSGVSIPGGASNNSIRVFAINTEC